MSLYDLTFTKVKDTSGKLADPTDYDGAIAEAMHRYSRHRPRLQCADLSGSGTADIDLPTDWCPGLSEIVSIEYPVGNVPETLLESSDWKYYRTPDAVKLRMLAATPTLGATVRVLYSVMHDEDSLPETDLECIANLAAAFCLRQLAAAFGQTNDPTIGADVVNYRSKVDEFRRLAESYEELYNQHLGLKKNDTQPAVSVVAGAPDDGRVRLTHRR